MAAPAYDIGNIVYLRESAAIGHLEAMKVSGVSRHGSSWLYTVATNIANPLSASHYGDKIAHVNSKIIHFTESEFVNLCDALTLCRANAARILDNLDRQIDTLCEEI